MLFKSRKIDFKLHLLNFSKPHLVQCQNNRDVFQNDIKASQDLAFDLIDYFIISLDVTL